MIVIQFVVRQRASFVSVWNDFGCVLPCLTREGRAMESSSSRPSSIPPDSRCHRSRSLSRSSSLAKSGLKKREVCQPDKRKTFPNFWIPPGSEEHLVCNLHIGSQECNRSPRGMDTDASHVTCNSNSKICYVYFSEGHCTRVLT